MCTERKYETFQESRLNELFRIPIHLTLIELINIKIDPYDFFLNFIDKDNNFALRITKSLNTSRRLGLIEKNKEKDMVTHLGYFCASLPLSLKCSTFLYKWMEKDYPIGIGIYLAAILDSYNSSFFQYPHNSEGLPYDIYKEWCSKYYDEYFSRFNSDTNFGATLNMWKEIFETFEGFMMEDKEIIKYCKLSSLNSTMIRACLRSIRSLNNILKEMNFDIEYGTYNTNNAIKLAVPILREIYSDQIFIRKSTTHEDIAYRLNNDQSDIYFMNLNTIIAKSAKYENSIIGLRVSEVRNKYTERIKKMIHIEIPFTYADTENTEDDEEIDIPDI